MRNLPAIADMMEELADQVLIQMNRQAVTGFKTSLREMMDFHRFLIAAHTTQENGKAFNFAQISGTWTWSAPYREWSGEYARLIEKAAELIDVDSTFIAYFSELPLSLISKNYKDIPTEMVVDLLGLSCYLVWKMEGWVSSRRVDYLAAHDHTPIHPMAQSFPLSTSYPEKINLSGTDIKSYETALARVISGWENVLSYAHNFYDWEKAETATPEVYWEHLSAGWDYLERHLKNTAYMLAACVWNDDPIGAKDYASTLLRWSSKAAFYMKNNDYYFQSKTLITADIMKDQWDEAQSLAFSYTYHDDHVDPASLMIHITKNAHKDAIMVACGIAVGWHINGKLNSYLPLKTAKGLLDGSLVGEGSQFERTITNFSTFMLNLVRIFSSSTYTDNSKYKATLDGWVQSFDQMSERRVIPGRTYSPSTKDHCEDLIGSWVICALALFSEVPTEADGFQQRFEDLLENEDYFLDRDHSIRSLEKDLSKMSEILTQIEDSYLDQAMAILIPKTQNIQKEQFATFLLGLIDLIQSKRLERINEREIDTEKLNQIRESALPEIFAITEKAKAFSNFQVNQSPELQEGSILSVSGMSTGQFVTPEMDFVPSNYDYLTQYLPQNLYGKILSSFVTRERQVLDLEDQEQFWLTIKETAKSIKNPILFVGNWFNYQMRRGFEQNTPYGFVYSGRDNAEGENFICSLDNIKLFRLRYDQWRDGVSKAILFSRDILEEVRLHAVDDGSILRVTFEKSEDDPWSGKLVFRYAPEFVWRDMDIFEFSYSLENTEDE